MGRAEGDAAPTLVDAERSLGRVPRRPVGYRARDGRSATFDLEMCIRDSLKEVLTAESVTGIGADALMIDDTTAIDEAAADEESLRHLKAAKPVVGNRVVSSDGNALGLSLIHI